MSANDLKSDITAWEMPGRLPMVYYRANDTSSMRLPLKKPFLAADDRFSYVNAGSMEVSVNMHQVTLVAGQAIYTSEGSIVEIVSESADFELHSCGLIVKPLGSMHPHHRVFGIDASQRMRLEHYFTLLLALSDRNPKVAVHVQQALLTDVFTAGQVVDVTQVPPQQRSLYNDFIELVSAYATAQRSVEYYARQLNVSPSRLMTTVKKMSGRTVMQWINMRTLMQAKALLAYSDMAVADIGSSLGINDPNYFSRFFRHETGMTPSEYRRRNT